MYEKIGVIALPMIFGPSKSFRVHCAELHLRSYGAAAVSLYAFKAPLFIKYVAGPGHARRLAGLANALNDEVITRRIQLAAIDLRRRQGCTKVAILGFGYGGIAALRAAALMNAAPEPTEAGRIDDVVAWYPHLVMPEGITKPPPTLDIGCPVQLFYGGADTETEGSLSVAEAATRELPGVKLKIYPGVGHAFADRYVQGSFLSPKYNAGAATDSWRRAMSRLDNLPLRP